MSVDLAALEAAARMILKAIGEDETREGLKETPRRFAALWREFIDYNPGEVATTFLAVKADQMVVVSGMRMWSFCEHHLLPFWADVSIGYIVTKRVLGLSKFGRIAQKHAHRLQLQERVAEDVANEVELATGSPHVAVMAKGEHLCMTMRGIKTPAVMTTTVMRGDFRLKPEARQEFLHVVSLDR